MERPWSNLTQRTASGTCPPPQVTEHGARARVSHLQEGKASAPKKATPQDKTPSSLGDPGCCPRAVSHPTHQAGHRAAWQTSRRFSGLLARSQSSSWTGVLRAESTHMKRSSIRPAGRKKGPRAPRGGLSQQHRCPLSEVLSQIRPHGFESWLCHLPAV